MSLTQQKKTFVGPFIHVIENGQLIIVAHGAIHVENGKVFRDLIFFLQIYTHEHSRLKSPYIQQCILKILDYKRRRQSEIDSFRGRKCDCTQRGSIFTTWIR